MHCIIEMDLLDFKPRVLLTEQRQLRIRIQIVVRLYPGRRLLVVESILTPTEFKDTLAAVIFDHFDIPSLCFAPSHLLAIYTLGIDTALVVDAGKCMSAGGSLSEKGYV